MTNQLEIFRLKLTRVFQAAEGYSRKVKNDAKVVDKFLKGYKYKFW